MSPRPTVLLEYRRVAPVSDGRHVFRMRGVWVVLGLIGVVVLLNLIMLLLLFLA